MSAANLELRPLKCVYLAWDLPPLMTFRRHIYTSPEVPYTARLYAQNSTYLEKFVLGLMAPLQNATQDLLGGVVRGGWPGTGGPEENLMFGGATPFSYDGSFRRMWIQLKQNTLGSFLKALDMYFYVDFTSMDPTEWYLIRMVYNRQVFATTEEFMDAYLCDYILAFRWYLY